MSVESGVFFGVQRADEEGRIKFVKTTEYDFTLDHLVRPGTHAFIFEDLTARILKANDFSRAAHVHDVSLVMSFVWMPSHIGLAGNDMADGLAKAACMLDVGDMAAEPSLRCQRNTIYSAGFAMIVQRSPRPQGNSREYETSQERNHRMFPDRMAVAVCLLESKWVPSSTLMAVGGWVELESWWIETCEQLEDSEW
ncbi:hypothetical protein Pcinc_016981 [Petrolisthes cinctipes]|uniref:RNase H type-1 domain-containing protein n=1 Tax=Petrolisthes cinctipes TaxID=88211 RepID=A0AAE1FQ13_PETCI|nr:hypothetical protein Pcinc_016981 [Petrolisthes cinctipes]